MITACMIDFSKVDWEHLDKFGDRTVFQTREWVEFLAETQNARPTLMELRDRNALAGYFTGLIWTKWGIKILGSSLPGWTTPYMGFNLLPGFARMEALAAVERVAFLELGCLHVEICDPYFAPENGSKLGFVCGSYVSHQTDLRQPEARIFLAMNSSCRRAIRKAEKSGVTVEEACDPDFADEYYEQLKEVYAKQGLVPSYGVERVRALIRHLGPTGRLLLVRARNPDGKCIATGIFPGFNKIAEFWGNASWGWGQILRPNEAIHWYAIRYWKKRGIQIYDWGGENPYKEKYGGVPFSALRFSKSRYSVLSRLRNGAQRMVAGKQRFLGWLEGASQAHGEL